MIESSIFFASGKLSFINQTKLPDKEEYITTDNYERIAEAIERLEIRGAPLIGIAALYALALAVKYSHDLFEVAYKRLFSTRPTAVNLFTALQKARDFFYSSKENQTFDALLKFAEDFHQQDKDYCEKISLNGADFIRKNFDKKLRILTHCNTGIFATGGIGTALGVIKKLAEKNLIDLVYSCETRPLLQGLRLTAYELKSAGIEYRVITDSSAAFLMQKGLIDFAIVGADRIAKNGDAANKIGTYSLAVNCYYHSIPFFVAAPSTTIDQNISTGGEILIEIRKPEELLSFGNNKVIQSDLNALNFAFDVTPNELINAIFTEKGVYQRPYNLSYDENTER